MRKILFFALSILLSAAISTACRFAPKEETGDTVAASVFEPHDPVPVKTVPETDSATVKDSVEADSLRS